MKMVKGDFKGNYYEGIGIEYNEDGNKKYKGDSNNKKS